MPQWLHHLCDREHVGFASMRKLSLTVGICALALTGCGDGGGGGSDSDQIKSVIKDAYGAFADGDAKKFCDKLTVAYREDFEDYYGPCEDATLDKVNASLSPEAKKMLEDPSIGTFKVDKGYKSAYPEVNGDGLEIKQEQGEWKLDDFDLPES